MPLMSLQSVFAVARRQFRCRRLHFQREGLAELFCSSPRCSKEVGALVAFG